jgi:hypothetical protein
LKLGGWVRVNLVGRRIRMDDCIFDVYAIARAKGADSKREYIGREHSDLNFLSSATSLVVESIYSGIPGRSK